MEFDKRKIALMSKVAVYEKNGYQKDKTAGHYYRLDYVFKKNITNIILVTFMSAVWIGIFEFINIFNNELIFDADNLLSIFYKSITWIGLIDIIFIVIGFFVFSNEYNKKRARLDSYYRALEKINGYYDNDEDDSDDTSNNGNNGSKSNANIDEIEDYENKRIEDIGYSKYDKY